MIFGKKKKQQASMPTTIKEASQAESAPAEPDITEAEASGSQDDVSSNDVAESTGVGAEPVAPSATIDAGNGKSPSDVSAVNPKSGFIDFGAILVPTRKDQKVRLDIDQKTQRVVSLTVALEDASIQLQAFSAPKSGGVWKDVRTQIEESIVKQKGRAKIIEGRFGPEVHARVPTVLKDGRSGYRAARFIGFEGERWFLRGVIGGRGAINAEAARAVEDLFGGVAVVRGDSPLPPRELLTLRAPEGAKRVAVPRQSSAAANGATANDSSEGNRA